LASIGGLFGALSIIITGALLYAIFTARTEDKWYYIIAVLINVSLLIVLMIGAIIFDKVYLKKFSNNTRRLHQSSPSRHTSRTIHVNPTLCQNNYVNHHSIINELNNRSNSNDFFNSQNLNDVPPSYDTSTSTNIVKPNKFNNRNINTISNQISNENESRVDALIPSSIYVTVTNLNQIKRDNCDLELDQNGKFLPPPNYFDLYPLKENDRSVILEHNLIISSNNAIGSDTIQPSQNISTDNSDNSRCIHIDSVERNN
jgi:hypothetical protein